MKEKLEKTITKANDAYRKGNPIMEDFEYDGLIDQLKKEYPNSPILKRSVIEKPSGRMESLPIPMYSLNKCKSIKELADWITSKKIPETARLVCTPKYDSISLCAEEDTHAGWTRGDGVEGQRSDGHLKVMGINFSGFIPFTYGEAIISRDNWERYFEGKINPKTNMLYSNARNVVAGMFNSPDPIDNLKHVDYVRYGTSQDVDKTSMLQNIWECQQEIPSMTIFAGSLLDNPKHLEKTLDDLYQKWNKDYAIDGIVIDVDDREIRRNLGREKNMNPSYARAYKNPKWSQGGKAKVEKVTIHVSKQGKQKPVINIEPLAVDGVIIRNVTGYNIRYMIDNNIAEGSEIEIIRSGDVIPKHINTISYSEDNVRALVDDAMECPSCGEQTVWDKTDTELVCINKKCKEQVIKQLVHFFKTMDVEDFGEPSIRSFYEAGHTTIMSILDMKIDNICLIDGFAVASAQRLVVQFYHILDKGVIAAKLLHAMDLFEGKCGEKVLQNIFNSLDFEDKFTYKYLTELTPTKLSKIKGVSIITAKHFLDGMGIFFLTEISNRVIIDAWRTVSKKKKEDGKMFGQAVCFTGFRSESLEAWIEEEGGDIKSGVSKKLNILLVDDPDSGTVKLRKAKDYGVEVLTKDQFEDKYM